MSIIIVIINQKGGVGKTSSCVNIGTALALDGNKTLIVDFDPQGAVATTLGFQPDLLESTIYEVLFGNLNPAAAIFQTPVENLSILPSNLQLAEGEVRLIGSIGGEYYLKKALNRIQDQFDYILIDTPPSLSLLSTNALVAADKVLIPVSCDILSLRGMENLLEHITRVKEILNPDLSILGIIINMFDKRTLHARESKELLEEEFGKQIKIFQTVIMNTTKIRDAWGAKESVILYDKNAEVTREYIQLAKEVENATKKNTAD